MARPTGTGLVFGSTCDPLIDPEPCTATHVYVRTCNWQCDSWNCGIHTRNKLFFSIKSWCLPRGKLGLTFNSWAMTKVASQMGHPDHVTVCAVLAIWFIHICFVLLSARARKTSSMSCIMHRPSCRKRRRGVQSMVFVRQSANCAAE